MQKKCCNCMFRGQVFNLASGNHLHCEHPKYGEEPYKTMYENGELSAWDTLKQLLETCEDHQLKTK